MVQRSIWPVLFYSTFSVKIVRVMVQPAYWLSFCWTKPQKWRNHEPLSGTRIILVYRLSRKTYLILLSRRLLVCSKRAPQYVHWKPDIRSRFIPEKNGLACDFFLHAIHIQGGDGGWLLSWVDSGFQCNCNLPRHTWSPSQTWTWSCAFQQPL